MKKFILESLVKIRDIWQANYPSLTLNIPVYNRNDIEYENKRRLDDPKYLDRFGYKVFSQNDEDGIITEIFKRIGTTNKKFVEFGVQNGLESNGHYLLHKGWSGLWIDGNKECVNQVLKLFENPIKKNQLKVINAFITTDNSNELIGKERIIGMIDLLSIDIDGNDYHIWETITCVKPRVVVIEYNSKFPPPYEWIMPYNPEHIWDEISDYWGASLSAMVKLGDKLGYQLVGTNMTGVNAFFVEKSLANDLFPKPATAENLYHSWDSRRYVCSGYMCSGNRSLKYIGN